MAQKELPVVRGHSDDWKELEDALIELFRQELYIPLIRALRVSKREIITNAADDLLAAIRKDRVRYYRGAFRGKFSAEISRELKSYGARWDPSSSSWRIAASDLPLSIRTAIRVSMARFEKTVQKIDERLRELLPEDLAEKIQFDKIFDRIIFRADKRVRKTLEKITVQPEISPVTRKRLVEEYTQNMKLYIQNFTKKQIVELRERVQKRAISGSRYEDLVKTVQKSYGVSKSKAKFLARQETNILLSKLKTSCYTENGVTHYKWRSVIGSPKHPVRPRHKELNDQSLRGKLFRFDDPPVMDDGQKKNPGEDYNCRCVAVPVVNFSKGKK
jgi:SPP1 gp7 family putative phage head morphogenesis protein